MQNEYISREAALAVIGNAPGDHGYDRGVDYSYEAVQNLPAADVAPVVHARWVDRVGSIFGWCSHCGKSTTFHTPYCPKCGARMDAKEDAHAS